jgi:hypothetical protein
MVYNAVINDPNLSKYNTHQGQYSALKYENMNIYVRVEYYKFSYFILGIRIQLLCFNFQVDKAVASPDRSNGRHQRNEKLWKLPLHILCTTGL